VICYKISDLTQKEQVRSSSGKVPGEDQMSPLQRSTWPSQSERPLQWSVLQKFPATALNRKRMRFSSFSQSKLTKAKENVMHSWGELRHSKAKWAHR